MKRILIICITAALVASCSKNPVMPEEASVIMTVKHEANGTPLVFDTMRYKNKAGNEYSVQRLQYYLSGFRFLKSDGTSHRDTSYFYVDARRPETTEFTLDQIPPGTYSGLAFYIGLPPEQNESGFLGSDPDHLNMFWPDEMGGGYHFIKFEGRYKDGDKLPGYAIHLGKNIGLAEVRIEKSFTLMYHNHEADLTMNLNEWFHNPGPAYDFHKDMNHTMSNDSLIKEFARNGAATFTLKAP